MSQKLFIYGTLKSGEPNRWLIDYLLRLKHIQEAPRPARTEDAFPLVTDPQTDHVPILVDRRGLGERIEGEIVEISEKGAKVLDEFEGLDQEGEYKRINIDVVNRKCCFILFLFAITRGRVEQTCEKIGFR